MKILVVLAAALLLASSASAAVSLHGSPTALALQNRVANREDLSRLQIDRRLPDEYSWARPETRLFLRKIGSDFARQFHEAIQVNSAVRTAEYQKKLRKKNGNAARGDSELTRSSHLTGATVDIAKKGMSTVELRWMRNRLIALEKAGCIEATEEHRQPVFHIMVFDKARCVHEYH